MNAVLKIDMFAIAGRTTQAIIPALGVTGRKRPGAPRIRSAAGLRPQFCVALLGTAFLAGCLSAAPALAQVIIQDNFSGTNASSVVGESPDTTNLPSGTWATGGSTIKSATYNGSNQIAIDGTNGALEIPTSGSGYTPPPLLTVSASLSMGGVDGNTDNFSRGVGLGFFSSIVPTSQAVQINNMQGLTIIAAGVPNASAGSVELDIPGGTNGDDRVVAVPFPSALGTYSSSAFYTLAYTVNTSTGQISNVSLSNGTTIDTTDYAPIDNTNTSGVFTVSNTAYVAILQTSAYGAIGYAGDFELSSPVTAPTGSSWTGADSTTWATAGNWSGAVPGSTSSTSNSDTAIFNTSNTANLTPLVDLNRNLQNIVFDNTAGNLTASLTLGTTSGNSLLLTSGGVIETTPSVVNSQNVNAPLVLEGTNGTYTFSSNAGPNVATLNFGGRITAGASSGTTTLILGGYNGGANSISGPIANGSAGATLALAVSSSSWVLSGANTYTGATAVSGGTLTVGNGSSGSLAATPISVSAGSLVLAAGGSIGNAAILVTGTGAFAVQAGSGTLSAGATGTGTAGATLSLGAGTMFSMVDGAVGTFNLQQQSSFGAANTALTLGGATLNFDLGSSAADSLNVKVGSASVSGTNTIGISTVGSSLTIGGNYTLISAPGGLSGTFQFAGGTSTTYVSAGSSAYQLTLHNSNTAESVSVGPSSLIIGDTFAGTNGSTIVGQTPSLANLPGGAWQAAAPGNVHSAVYSSPNQLALAATNGAVVIPTSSGRYTPPAMLTLSAGLAVNGINGNADYFGRGLGLGFFASVATGSQPVEYVNGGFIGLTLDAFGGGNNASAAGSVELDIAGNNVETQAVIVPFPSALGTFNPSTVYTLSYTVNTTTGQISNVSLSDGTVTDTQDYAAIDNYDTTATGPNGAFFTVANTAYVGIANSAAYSGTGDVTNFQLSAAAPSVLIGSNWTGTNSTVWSDPGNWNGNVPGATSGTADTDTAVFNTYNSANPTPAVDPGRNLQNIVFDNSTGMLTGSLTLGTTSGNPLLLTAGGSIQTTASVADPQTVNAPLVLEGAYTFTSNSTTSSATLNFGGKIMPDASLSSSPTTLTLNGSNAGLNTISGVLSDNGSAQLAVSVSGTGVWVLNGATSTFSGGTTIVSGATLELAGSVSTMSQSMDIANSGSLLVASSTNQKVGTILGTGSVTVSSGSLTAYEIRQNSLTIGSGATVTLSPAGSGSTTNPTGPNNINFSSMLTSLTIAGTTGAWTGTLDIGNNGLVIEYGTAANDPYATIDNMIEMGFDAAHWDGQGITSSLGRAAANSHTPLNIGLVDFTPGVGNFSNTTFIVFEGQTVTINAILIRLTYMDDIVLAGDLNAQDASSDALIFAANYGTGTTWSVGDLEHTGLVGSADALLFAANYTPPLASLDGTTGGNVALSGNTAGVPEPSSAALAALAAIGLRLLARRRR